MGICALAMQHYEDCILLPLLPARCVRLRALRCGWQLRGSVVVCCCSSMLLQTVTGGGSGTVELLASAQRGSRPNMCTGSSNRSARSKLAPRMVVLLHQVQLRPLLVFCIQKRTSCRPSCAQCLTRWHKTRLPILAAALVLAALTAYTDYRLAGSDLPDWWHGKCGSGGAHDGNADATTAAIDRRC